MASLTNSQQVEETLMHQYKYRFFALGLVAGLDVVIGVACSTVDPIGGAGAVTFGTFECFIFPGAEAWDEQTYGWHPLVLANDYPQYCWCRGDDYVLSPEELASLETLALEECVASAQLLGYDTAQTTCASTMQGPVAGGIGQEPTCPLYEGDEFQTIGDGDTGGELPNRARSRT